MSLDSNGLPGRFFSLFPRYKQREIAECLYPGEDGSKKQPQISKWMKGLEPIPMEALDRVVDLGLAKWDWLLTGQGGEEPFPDVLSKPQSKTPPAEASGEWDVTNDLIEAVFLVQEALAHFGKALAMRKSGSAAPDLSSMIGMIQRLQVLLGALQQTPEVQDRTA